MQEFPLHTNASMTLSEIDDRFGYHRHNEVSGRTHADVRLLFIRLARQLDEILPAGRAKSLAFTELENAAMWAGKSISQQDPVVPL